MSNAIWRTNITAATFGGLSRQFVAWYGSEFQSLLSPRAKAWLFDRGERKLVIQASQDGVSSGIAREGEASDDVTQTYGASLKEVFAAKGTAVQSTTKIILELPQERFFVRDFDIPLAARANLPTLLAKDIERKTPFRLSDILFGHVIARDAAKGDKLKVTQWILRRDIVEEIVGKLGLSFDNLDIVRPATALGSSRELPDIVVGRRGEPTHWFRTLCLGMFAVGLAAFVGGFAFSLWRIDQKGEELDKEIAAASQRSSVVRKMADQATTESQLLSGMRRERERFPSLGDIWEEISRVLPDGAYLSEWRLSEQKPGERNVELVGLATGAAELPAILDKSPLFSETTLTAAITPDLQEKRERFSLQARLKPRATGGQK